MGGRRLWVGNGILVVVVGVVAYFGLTSLFHTASAHSATRTATVQVGTVSQTVTASGNISPAQSQTVNFATGGTVSTINVSVGQRVTAGQTLATLDPGPAQAALAAAQDNLTAAQDNLALAQNGNETPPQVQQDDATLSADQTAVNSAQTTLTADQTQLATYQAECSKSASAAAAAPTSTGSGGKAGGSTTSPTTTSSTSSNPCQLATSEQLTVNQDQNVLTQAQNALNQENLALATKRYANPATILQDEAQVTSAQAAVTQDQKALAETTLTAPFDATVPAVNGTLGQTVSGGGNSSVASGSSGSSGGSGGGSGGGTAAGSSAAASSSSSSSSSGSSSGFVTLANLASLQVVAGFPEASAVKVKVGQPATVTLSATNSTASGTVTSLNPTPSVVSNVVTYQVTVTLQNPPASVQDGMSATVAVVVASAGNALELPSSAITTTGRISTVELLKNGKQVLTPITVGLVGDSTTQILSGLSAGDTVVEPSVTVSGTGTTRTGTGGGLGGLFGGFGGGTGGGTGGGAGGGATTGRGG